MIDVALLILRLTLGGLLTGHGAQKLFGAFGGPGPQGTAGMMEALDLKPGQRWAAAAALSEFGGGVLTALGLFNPLGPLGIMGSMSMATATVHWASPSVTAGARSCPSPTWRSRARSPLPARAGTLWTAPSASACRV